MSFDQIQPYILPAAIIAFFGWRQLKFKRIKKDLPRLLAEGAVIVDVRTAAEFSAGSRTDSLNIPLDQLSKKISTLDSSRPVIVCCASGSRSAMAAAVLKRHGFKKVVNAGPWTNTVGA